MTGLVGLASLAGLAGQADVFEQNNDISIGSFTFQVGIIEINSKAIMQRLDPQTRPIEISCGKSKRNVTTYKNNIMEMRRRCDWGVGLPGLASQADLVEKIACP